MTDVDRTPEVLKMLVAGESRPSIYLYAQKKEWGLPLAALDKLISDARRQIKAAANGDAAEALGKAVLRYEDLFQRNLKVQDYKAAAQCVEKLVKLLHLDEVAKSGEAQSAKQLLSKLYSEAQNIA